ncbi:MAG: hypothetical protein ACYCPN_01655 [Thermoplasmata archaeon]
MVERPPPRSGRPSEPPAATRRGWTGPIAAVLVAVAFLGLLLGFEGGAGFPVLEAAGSEVVRTLGTVGLLAVGILGLLAVGLGVAAYASARPPPELLRAGRPARAKSRRAAGTAWLRRELRRRGPRTVAELEARWPAGRAPRDLADWVAEELATGRIVATVREDRVPRIGLPNDRRSAPPPGVTVDRRAFLEALDRHRRLRDGLGDPSGEPDQDGSRPTRS